MAPIGIVPLLDFIAVSLSKTISDIFLSMQVSQDMGTEAPIPISTKLGDFNNVFRKIVSAAEHPHLSIPETETGRSRKQYHRLINRSLMFVSGMMSLICQL